MVYRRDCEGDCVNDLFRRKHEVLVVTVLILLCARGVHNLDNRWVVPINMFCATKYLCHMNVELCASINSSCQVHSQVRSLTAVLCSRYGCMALTSASVTATCLHCPTLHVTASNIKC